MEDDTSQGQEDIVGKRFLRPIATTLLEKISNETEHDVSTYIKIIQKDTLTQLFHFKDEDNTPSSEHKKKLKWPKVAKKDKVHSETETDDFDAIRKELLPAALRRSYVDTANILLESGCDPFEKGNTDFPLELATRKNDLTIINKILSQLNFNADDGVKSQIKTSIISACEVGNIDALQCLSDHMRRIYGDLTQELNPDGGDFDPVFTSESNGFDLKPVIYALWVREENETEDSQTDTTQLAADLDHKNLRIFDEHLLQPQKPSTVLSSINLSYNPLDSVPRALLYGLPYLKVLNLSHCSLRGLPIMPTDAPDLRLETLDISNNENMKSIPDDIFMIPSLRSLHCNHNNLESIDRVHRTMLGIHNWRCSSLAELSVSNNKLKEIPDQIAAASELRTLIISHNQLRKFSSLWKCPLEKLDVSFNELADLPDLHIYWKPTLKKLYIEHNQLESIPTTICHLSTLKALNVSDNKITKLDQNLEWQTTDLEDLDLSGNQLTYLDDVLLENLQSETADRKSKETFWKKHTGQKEVPNWLDETHDNLLDRQLVFPLLFQSNLESLKLNSNQLQAIPDTICAMHQLQILELRQNNYITTLPKELGVLKMLSTLDLGEVKIRNPSSVAVMLRQSNSDASTVIRLLREDLLQYQRYRGVKVMLIGPKGSGKTSVLNRMMSTNESSDNKVTVREWIRRRATPTSMPIDPIVFTIWDIQGGFLNSAISQTLFTPNTIYILVWDADKGTIDEVPSWLLNVKLMARNSPVIAVASHIDALTQRSSEQDTLGDHYLCDKLEKEGKGTLCDIITKEVYVDAYHPQGRGIQQLSKLIFKTARSMEIKDVDDPSQMVELIGRKVPKAFLSTKDVLSEKLKEQQQEDLETTPRLMTETKFASILTSIDETENIHSHLVYGKQQVVPGIVEFLRDSGSLIHISDHTYRLTNVYFLDPNWICQLLSAVLEEKGMSQKVTRNELNECARKFGFKVAQLEDYLQLLGRFEIALKASKDGYILPLLMTEKKPYLKDARPMLSCMFKHRVMRWYKMRFLPTGLMSRLVCRILADLDGHRNSWKPYIEPVGTAVNAWQEGIVLASACHQINVELLSSGDGSPCICLSIQSEQKEQLIKCVGFIVDHIEYLIKEWYSDHANTVQRLVPCLSCLKTVFDGGKVTGLSYIESTCSILPESDLILEAVVRGKEEFQCSNSETIHNLNLRDTLPDVFLCDLGVEELQGVPKTEGEDTKLLGEGSFGVVYEARINGEPRAIKSLLRERYHQSASEANLSQFVIERIPVFRKEVALMKKLNHPCVLSVLGVSIPSLCFAMELAPLGDLSGFLEDQFICSTPEMSTSSEFHRTILDRRLTFKVAFQIFAAVDHLHQEGIIHTDLKTNNILMFSDNLSDQVNVKLTDYGISKAKGNTGDARGYEGRRSVVAPEIMKGKAFNEKIDIFSIGMILYHVVTGVPPSDDGQQFSSDASADSSDSRRKANFQFRDFMMKPNFKFLEWLMEECWEEHPDKRISASSAMRLMKSPSFLCLKNVDEFPDANNPCFAYATGNEEHSQSSTLEFWTGDADKRQTGEINLDNLTADHVINEGGERVSCFVVAADMRIVGTNSKGIYVFRKKRDGLILMDTLQNSIELHFDTRCMTYVTSKSKSTGSSENVEQKNYLYVGLEDGRMVVYEHTNSETKSSFKLHEVIQLTKIPRPCRSMLLVTKVKDGSEVLLAGCGEIIVFIDTVGKSVLPESITVPKHLERKQHIIAMIHRDDFVWCILSKSSQVYQFRLSDCTLTATFDCATRFPDEGLDILEVKRLSLPSPIMPNVADNGSTETVKENEAKQRVQRDNIYENVKGMLTVRSILVVKDTLWIGRSEADILVVALSDSAKFKFGQIIEVLGCDPILGRQVGPIGNLFNDQSGQVVAIRNIHKHKHPNGYQVSLWQHWGSGEFMRFKKLYAI